MLSMFAAEGSTLALYLLWFRTTSILAFGASPWTHRNAVSTTEIKISALCILPTVCGALLWLTSSDNQREMDAKRCAETQCSITARALCNFVSLKCNAASAKNKWNRRVELLSQTVLYPLSEGLIAKALVRQPTIFQTAARPSTLSLLQKLAEVICAIICKFANIDETP